MRRIWQKGMIALACSSKLKTLMQANRSASKLATRYVGGSDIDGAMAIAEKLSGQNIKSSLFYLGEYVDSQELVDENVAALFSITEAISGLDRDSTIDGHVSLDPTQVGCSIDWDMGASHARDIAQALGEAAKSKMGLNCLMIDMEDHDVVQNTIDLYRSLAETGLPMALTLQAYLKRTEDDIKTVIEKSSTERPGRVRLVKGAFVGSSDCAYVGHKAIKDNYLKLIDLMLSAEARACGFYPIFATHDHRFHAYAIDKALRNGWPQDSYEFEMLYGARDDVAQQLANAGETIRLYLPFGKDWWPYAVRRIGENPKNALLLARSLF